MQILKNRDNHLHLSDNARMKRTIAMLAALAFSAAPARAETAKKLETKIEEKDGKKTVTTVYAEGALAGKTKKSENFKDGKLAWTTEYFYGDAGHKTRTVEWKTDASPPEIADIKESFHDAEGKETHYVRLRSGSYSRWNLIIWHSPQGNQQWHVVPFKSEGIDVSEDLELLSLLPASSGYRMENITLSTALSEDGKSVVITLTNISNAPVEVHKDAFTRPRIDLNRPAGVRYTPFVIKEVFQETPLAPSDSLRHEIPLREIFENDAEVIKKLVFKNDPEAELYIHTNFYDLFPTSHDSQVAGTSLGRMSLGTFGEIRAKNPELFPSADTAVFNAKDVALSAALSEDGKSVVVTLTNVSDAPVKVNEGAFVKPRFSLSWFSKQSFGGSGGSGPFASFHEIRLAPGESLRHEATLKEIFENNKSIIEIVLSENDPEVKVSISTTFTDLLPFSPDTKSEWTRLDYVPLGMVRELKAKHPELFEEISKTDASSANTP